MAKQIITLEITFHPNRCETQMNHWKAWIQGQLIRVAPWITKVEIINRSPIHWEGEEDIDDPEFRKKFSAGFLLQEGL